MNQFLYKMFHYRSVTLFLALILYTPALIRAQTSLQIISPADGSTVNPGQTLTVSVSTSGAPPAQLTIVGEDPIGFSQVLTSAPYQFSIQVPSEIDSGMYTVTAWGVTAWGDTVESESISIDVERAGSPYQLHRRAIEPELMGRRQILPAACCHIQRYLHGGSDEVHANHLCFTIAQRSDSHHRWIRQIGRAHV